MKPYRIAALLLLVAATARAAPVTYELGIVGNESTALATLSIDLLAGTAALSMPNQIATLIQLGVPSFRAAASVEPTANPNVSYLEFDSAFAPAPQVPWVAVVLYLPTRAGPDGDLARDLSSSELALDAAMVQFAGVRVTGFGEDLLRSYVSIYSARCVPEPSWAALGVAAFALLFAFGYFDGWRLVAYVVLLAAMFAGALALGCSSREVATEPGPRTFALQDNCDLEWGWTNSGPEPWGLQDDGSYVVPLLLHCDAVPGPFAMPAPHSRPLVAR